MKTLIAIIKGVLSALFSFLKQRSFSLLLVQIIGTSVGFRAWILKFILEFAWDEIAEPLFKEAEDLGQLVIDQVDGKIKVKKVKEAIRNNNSEYYNDATNDIING